MNRGAKPRLVTLLLALVLASCTLPPMIEQEPADDARLATEVKIALVEEPTLDAAAIFVDAQGHRVELSGFVDTPAERDRAVAVAQEVPGVQQVTNSIQIR
jgi:hyperosmotically inducible periplasmic protein